MSLGPSRKREIDTSGGELLDNESGTSVKEMMRKDKMISRKE